MAVQSNENWVAKTRPDSSKGRRPTCSGQQAVAQGRISTTNVQVEVMQANLRACVPLIHCESPITTPARCPHPSWPHAPDPLGPCAPARPVAWPPERPPACSSSATAPGSLSGYRAHPESGRPGSLLTSSGQAGPRRWSARRPRRRIGGRCRGGGWLSVVVSLCQLLSAPRQPLQHLSNLAVAVTRLDAHQRWLPATRLPDHYRDQTFTG
jgi:hypothetical protein